MPAPPWPEEETIVETQPQELLKQAVSFSEALPIRDGCSEEAAVLFEAPPGLSSC